jgi:serine/threonine protein kinase
LSNRRSRTGSGNAAESGPALPVLAPGTRLGGFAVERFVGAGGMGEVYKARDTRLDRHVAIKLLRSDLATDPAAVLAFRSKRARSRACRTRASARFTTSRTMRASTSSSWSFWMVKRSPTGYAEAMSLGEALRTQSRSLKRCRPPMPAASSIET